MAIEETLRKIVVDNFGGLAQLGRELKIPETTLRSAFNKENGLISMQSKNLCAVCEALKIDMRELILNGAIKEQEHRGLALTQREFLLIEKYRQLDEFGLSAVDSILNIEKKRNDYYDNKINYIYKPYLEQQAAAGVGIDFESTDYELVKIVRDRLSETCDFVMKVNGESMEPDFPDGSYVMVRQFQPVNLGEIGIFLYQGEIFIKEMGKQSLLSKNSQFEPILVEDLDRFTLLGKVIGIAEVKE